MMALTIKSPEIVIETFEAADESCVSLNVFIWKPIELIKWILTGTHSGEGDEQGRGTLTASIE